MFSSQQQLIINYDFLNINCPNALCVVAGAGSGKTTTIIEKIVLMIRSGLKPAEFFITTFTRNASVQLKEKLHKYLIKEQIDQMCIGTFHSIAYYYLKKYNKTKYNVAQSFDKLLYDYLELTKTVQYQLNESHNYIFIDEYQDIDPIQYQIIDNIYRSRQSIPNNKLLMVIGDDQQNIYTFRGSNINYILNFEKTYGGKILKLETNYRCFPAIVNVSNYLLANAKEKIDKTFVPDPNLNKNKDKTKIRLKVISTSYEKKYQLENFIADKIELINQKYDISTYAIISRTKKNLTILENILARKKIPTTYLESLESNINYQNQQNHKQNKIQNNEQQKSNRLILTTIHGTKGLEYYNVVFIDFDHTQIPDTDIEEERRLYYVAITRAKSNLLILIENSPKHFLNEIFNGSHQNKTLFDNFDVKMIQKIPEYLIDKSEDDIETDKSVISVTYFLKNINWLKLIQLNSDGINFIDKSYHITNITTKLKFLSKIYQQNELITNYQYLIGLIVENYINYKLAISNNKSDFFTALLDNILIQSRNISNILKNSSYGDLLKKYYKLDITNDLKTYCEKNKDYLKNLLTSKDKYNYVDFIIDKKRSHYDSIFIDKITKSYSNLILKKHDEFCKELINDIIIYSINESILDNKRYSLQYLNINNYLSYFSDINKTDALIEILNQNILTDFIHTNTLVQRKLSYINLKSDQKIIGCSDIIIENDNNFMVIDIKATTHSVPDINYLLQIIIYSCMYMIETNKVFNQVGIYSALHGLMYIWEFNIDLTNANIFLENICKLDIE
jgi:ATP-dependent DNA helicase RecQ